MTIEERPDQFTNNRKADFNSIYNQPHPRAYFKALTPLQYQIPQQALPFVERVLELSSPSEDVQPRKVLDVCCSYGINAALLRYDLTLDTLSAHLASSPKLSGRDQIISDKRFFASKLIHPEVDVLGLDIAPEAIAYAVKTGLMKDGWAENLETSDPSLSLREGLKDVEVVVCTGGVGYVGASTFSRIADAVEDSSKLWIVTFVLRVFSFDEIADVLEEKHGLVTEKIPGHLFRQRRFTTREEQSAAVADVRARGLDTKGLEEDGWFYAECYVTRPRDVAIPSW
ncbi:methyltransferase type 12 [Colletotrichum chrysophilum]|uniref:Methyltransferase type 12 n=1 Tax=Colletotrichum chrysophilum TaxID=1836956 RepID=A0AAD9AUP3_9PEZI|nr:methyltransferase type 12 [Colletotrichum chrysophilum]